MKLRPYQLSAVDSILARHNVSMKDVLVLPTGCLAKDTPIKMFDGTIKPVQEIKSGDCVVSYDSYTNTFNEGVVGEVFRTCLNPKPMIELICENEKITTTYDHPFFDGESFHPLYQLVWGEMEASQRTQLKLLCKQYGQTFDHKKKRGLLSCCNETCPRCERVFKDSYEREDNKDTQNSCRKLVKEPIEVACCKSHKRNTGRQYSREPRMVFNQIQCVDRKENRENSSSDTFKERLTWGQREKGNKRILHKEHRGEKLFGKIKTVRISTKKVSTSKGIYYLQNCNRNLLVKEAEPYYSICMREAPYTYCIGKENCFVTHNSGKSIVIAEAVKRLNVPTLILQPSLEILVQNKEKLSLYFPPEEIGVYSASANEKVVGKITLATIGSVVKYPEKFAQFKNVMIDECHLVAPDDLHSMYLTFIKDIQPDKIVGLTATPIRLSTTYLPPHFNEQITTIKLITRMRGKAEKNFWDGGITFNIPTRDMIEQGYLHRPEYFDNTQVQHESIPVNKSGSDFLLDKYEELIMPHEEYIMDTIARLANISHSVLVFCTSVEQAIRYSKVLKNSAVVSADTPKKERKSIIDKFKEGDIKVVLNVSCLTTGFDHPRLDGLVMLRPTRSLGLYSQMVGRVLRIHPEKKHARIVDFAGNIKSMGHAESIEVYMNGRLPDIKTDKKVGWHGTVLYKHKVK